MLVEAKEKLGSGWSHLSPQTRRKNKESEESSSSVRHERESGCAKSASLPLIDLTTYDTLIETREQETESSNRATESSNRVSASPKYQQAIERLETTRRRNEERKMTKTVRTMAEKPSEETQNRKACTTVGACRDASIFTSKHERLVQMSLEYRRNLAYKEIINVEDEKSKDMSIASQGPAWRRLFIDTSEMEKVLDDSQLPAEKNSGKDFVSAFSYEFNKKRGDNDDISDVIVIDDILQDYYEQKEKSESSKQSNDVTPRVNNSSGGSTLVSPLKESTSAVMLSRMLSKDLTAKPKKINSKAQLSVDSSAMKMARNNSEEDDKELHIDMIESIRKAILKVGGKLPQEKLKSTPFTYKMSTLSDSDLTMKRLNQRSRKSGVGEHGVEANKGKKGFEDQDKVLKTLESPAILSRSNVNSKSNQPDTKLEHKPIGSDYTDGNLAIQSISADPPIKWKVDVASKSTVDSCPRTSTSLLARSFSKFHRRSHSNNSRPTLAASLASLVTSRRAVSSSPLRQPTVVNSFSTPCPDESKAETVKEKENLSNVDMCCQEEAKHVPVAEAQMLDTVEDFENDSGKCNNGNEGKDYEDIHTSTESQAAIIADTTNHQASYKHGDKQPIEDGGKMAKVEDSAAKFVMNLALNDISSSSTASEEVHDIRDDKNLQEKQQNHFASDILNDQKRIEQEDLKKLNNGLSESISLSKRGSDDSTSADENGSNESFLDSTTEDSEYESLEHEKYDSCSIPFAMHMLEYTCGAWMDHKAVACRGSSNCPVKVDEVKCENVLGLPQKLPGKYNGVEKHNRSSSILNGIARQTRHEKAHLKARSEGKKSRQGLLQKGVNEQIKKFRRVDFDTALCGDSQSVLTPKYSNTSKSKKLAAKKSSNKQTSMALKGKTRPKYFKEKCEVPKCKTLTISEAQSIDEVNVRSSSPLTDALRSADMSPSRKIETVDLAGIADSKDDAPSFDEKQPIRYGCTSNDPIALVSVRGNSIAEHSSLSNVFSNSAQVIPSKESTDDDENSDSLLTAGGPESTIRRRPYPSEQSMTGNGLSEAQRLAALSLAERLRSRAALLKRHRLRVNGPNEPPSPYAISAK